MVLAAESQMGTHHFLGKGVGKKEKKKIPEEFVGTQGVTQWQLRLQLIQLCGAEVQLQLEGR